MNPRALYSSLLARLERTFDRVALDRVQTDEQARGEFMSSLIIDHGATRAERERGSRPGLPTS